MLGRGVPQITGWERQKAPHASYGILRFTAGKLELPGKPPEELQAAAIVDVQTPSVIGLTLDKKGGKAATWSWEEGRLGVASAEGLQEDFVLRGGKSLSAAAGVAAAPERAAVPRRENASGGSAASPGAGGSTKQAGTPAWAPWSQNNGPTASPPRQQASKPQKPKSIFDMLFGN
jgi:hypothetical protein